jgi:hypothetical protein
MLSSGATGAGTSAPGDRYSQRRILATLKINGETGTYAAPDETPPLWVIREEFKLTGTKRRIIAEPRFRARSDSLRVSLNKSFAMRQSTER